jgi:hypothetical protein
VECRTWCGQYGVEISLTAEQIEVCSHPGPCDADVERVCANVMAAKRGHGFCWDVLAELEEYGAWDEIELSDASANLRRLVWIAANDLNEQVTCGHCGSWIDDYPGDPCPYCGNDTGAGLSELGGKLARGVVRSVRGCA